jgi:hypothetical protein
MVGGVLTRVSDFRVDLGVGGAVIASGSRTRPTHSCDRWVFDLGVVVPSSIFGCVRGTGAFVVVLPTFVSVSRMHVGLVVSGSTILPGSCAHPSHSWISLLLTSSLSLGISSSFCRATQCM